MTDTITLPRSVVEQALAAFEQIVRQHYRLGTEFDDRAKALRTALEQPQVEQEPVAVVTGFYGGFPVVRPLEPATVLPAGMALYTRPQNLNCESTQARLATPWGYEKPQPSRQPLTQAQVVDLFCSTPHAVQYVGAFSDGVRYAERAHGIRGEA